MTDLPDDILAAVVRISASSPPDDEALPDDIRDAVARIAATDLDCVEADATDLQAAIDFAVKRVDGRCYLCGGSLYETQQGPRCLEHNMTPQPPQSSPPSSPLPPVSKLADAISRISGAGVPRAHVSMVDPFALASPTITLTRDQRDAVSRVVAWRVDPTGPRFLSLTGAAGTGKSTLMAAIRERLRGTRTAWSAMTGKAALRMREAAGVHARTFHGVVFHPPREVDNEVEQKIDLEFEAVKAEGLGCLLVVDECFESRQRILTESGWREIGQVVRNREKHRVRSRNPANGFLELKPIVRWLQRDTPVDPLLEINVGRTKSRRNARLLRCTRDHKILTLSGYVRAGDLRVGDRVVVRGSALTSTQRSVLIGMLLGDGSMTRKQVRNSLQVSFSHGQDQLNYLKFKRQLFGVLSSSISVAPSGFENGKPVYRVCLDTVDEYNEIAEEMPLNGARHRNGRRQWSPTDAFLSMVDDQALAIWYLDNGSSTSKHLVGGGVSHYGHLHTQRFVEADNRRLEKMLRERFGIEAITAEDGKGYWYLRLNKGALTRLFEIVQPFVPACMAWKTAGVGQYECDAPTVQPDTTVARVRSIAEAKRRKGYKHVYDIEVADFHNYVAGNVIVSNCSMLGPKLRADADRSAYDKILFVGDPYQIPAVLSKSEEEASGADYSVFADVPGPCLKEVMRTSGAVLQAATRVREHHEVPTDSATSGGSEYHYQEADRLQDTVGLAVQAYLDDPVGHALITWRNDVRMTASLAIRSLLGIDDALPQRGEPMVIRRNVYGTDLMNGDAVQFDGWGAPGPDLAGVATRYAAVRSNSGEGQVIELLVPTGRFDGSMPYVPLQVWRKAVHEAEVDDPTPLTWGYALTCHMAQGSEWRRVTTFLPGDLSNPHFRKMTRLPDGSQMSFSMRFLYTALTRAKQSTSLIVSR